MSAKWYIAAGVGLLFLASCIKPPEYSEVPYLEFSEINKTSFVEYDPDSLKLTIYFEDGDGDIGGAEIDSLNMFSKTAGFRVISYRLRFRLLNCRETIRRYQVIFM